MKNARRAGSFVRRVSAITEENDCTNLAIRTLLIRSCSRPTLFRMIDSGGMIPAEPPVSFFAGSAWRHPPKERPLALALAISSGEWESAATSWPGDVGGLKRYAGLSAEEAKAWKVGWEFRAKAFRHYLKKLLEHAFSPPEGFLTGSAPSVGALPEGSSIEEVALHKTLLAAPSHGKPDGSAWTPEVRLSIPGEVQDDIVNKMSVCIVDPDVSADEVSQLAAGLPSTRIAIRVADPPISLGIAHQLRHRQSLRAEALNQWSVERQQEAWRNV